MTGSSSAPDSIAFPRGLHPVGDQLSEGEASSLLELASALALPQSSRQNVRGESAILGLTSPGGKITVNTLGGAAVDLIRLANELLCARAQEEKDSLILTSIALNHNTCSAPHVDSYNEGESVIVLFGTFQGGAFNINGE